MDTRINDYVVDCFVNKIVQNYRVDKIEVLNRGQEEQVIKVFTKGGKLFVTITTITSFTKYGNITTRGMEIKMDRTGNSKFISRMFDETEGLEYITDDIVIEHIEGLK